MDQYKRTDGNPSLRRSVSTKVEGTNEIAHLKSEIILLKRQNERLLKKEKRLQVTSRSLLILDFFISFSLSKLCFCNGRLNKSNVCCLW